MANDECHTRNDESGAWSALFPSWTKDGRICFRYDDASYRGFMFVDDVLSAPEEELPQHHQNSIVLLWPQLFPETEPPRNGLNVVMVWSSWSAHSPDALKHLQEFGRLHKEVGVATAVELSSRRADLDRLRLGSAVTLREIPLAPTRLMLTEAMNQIPTTLLFRDGVMVDRRLGAQTATKLHEWIRAWSDKR